MTAPTWADRSLPLAERVALAMLDWDMDDAHQAHRAELVADVAATDRLAVAVTEDSRAWRSYQDACGSGKDDAALDALAAAVARADREHNAALAAYRARREGVANG